MATITNVRIICWVQPKVGHRLPCHIRLGAYRIAPAASAYTDYSVDGTGYREVDHDMPLNPFTGLAWLESDITGTDYGMYLGILGDNRSTWQLGAIVAWCYYEVTWSDATVTYYMPSFDATGGLFSTPYPTDWQCLSELLTTSYCWYYGTTAGSSWDSVIEYMSPVALPVVTTQDASSVDEFFATLNGYLSDDKGLVCNCFFEWGTTVAYGNTTPNQVKVSGESFSEIIAGFSLLTPTHFRAAVTCAFGTSYGIDKTFFPYSLPVGGTLPATRIT